MLIVKYYLWGSFYYICKHYYTELNENSPRYSSIPKFEDELERLMLGAVRIERPLRLRSRANLRTAKTSNCKKMIDSYVLLIQSSYSTVTKAKKKREEWE